MGLEGAGPDVVMDPAQLRKVRMVPYLTHSVLLRHSRMTAYMQKELKTKCEAWDLSIEGKSPRTAPT